jgi:hypothetical protein
MTTLTRKELHNLVWSEPVIKLALRFGLSDCNAHQTLYTPQLPSHRELPQDVEVRPMPASTPCRTRTSSR